MKRIVILICCSLFTTAVFSQIPSIREKRITSPKKVLKKNTNESVPFFKASKKDVIELIKLGSIKRSDSISIDSTKLDQYFKFNAKGILTEVYNPSQYSAETLEKMIKVDTIKLVYYDYYLKQADTLEKEIVQRETQIKKENKIEDITKEDQIIQTKKQYLKKYKDAIKTIEKKHFVEETAFFPTILGNKQRAFEKVFSKNSERSLYLANNASLQLNRNGTILESELVSAYLGVFRVTFGSLVTNTNDDTENTEGETDDMMTDESVQTDNTEAFQRLLEGGGNAFLNLELPLFLYQSKRWFLYANTSGRVGLEISEFSDDIDTSTGNGNISGNLYTSISTDNKELTFFGYINYGVYFGADSFYERLEINNNNEFWFGKVTAGVTIQNRLRFSLTFNTFSSEKNLRSGNIVIGAQILPGLFD